MMALKKMTMQELDELKKAKEDLAAQMAAQNEALAIAQAKVSGLEIKTVTLDELFNSKAAGWTVASVTTEAKPLTDEGRQYAAAKQLRMKVKTLLQDQKPNADHKAAIELREALREIRDAPEDLSLAERKRLARRAIIRLGHLENQKVPQLEQIAELVWQLPTVPNLPGTPAEDKLQAIRYVIENNLRLHGVTDSTTIKLASQLYQEHPLRYPQQEAVVQLIRIVEAVEAIVNMKPIEKGDGDGKHTKEAPAF